jgi:Skp family chaperone for outer membrane proteins
MLLCLTMALTLAAQDTQPGIGILVFNRVIEQSARGRQLFSELETLKKTLGDKLQAKQTELMRVQSQLQSPSISDSGKEALLKQQRDLEFENKKLNDDSNLEFQKTQQKVVGQFQKELSPFVEELAKEQKLKLVLQFQPEIVAWADPVWIVAFSDEVAKRYDAKYMSPAPAGAAKPAGKPAAKPAAKPAS